MDRQGLRAGGGCQRPVAAVARVRLPAIRKPETKCFDMATELLYIDLFAGPKAPRRGLSGHTSTGGSAPG